MAEGTRRIARVQSQSCHRTVPPGITKQDTAWLIELGEDDAESTKPNRHQTRSNPEVADCLAVLIKQLDGEVKLLGNQVRERDQVLQDLERECDTLNQELADKDEMISDLQKVGEDSQAI